MANTINGRKIIRTKVFEEGGQWRWRIIDDRGAEFLDGGNYNSKDAAERGLDGAFDPPNDEQAAKLRQLIADGGYTQRGAARELEISERMMRYYCAGEQSVPRVVMLAMEHLVNCPHVASSRA